MSFIIAFSTNQQHLCWQFSGKSFFNDYKLKTKLKNNKKPDWGTVKRNNLAAKRKEERIVESCSILFFTTFETLYDGFENFCGLFGLEE